MKHTRSLLLFGIAIVSLLAIAACSDNEEPEATTVTSETASTECSPLEEAPTPVPGAPPSGPPPSLPYIFAGTASVNGEPVPEGHQIFVKLTTSRSWPVPIGADGSFRDMIHGPVSEMDNDVPFVFCLGDPEGTSYRAEETVEYEDVGTFNEVLVELNFPDVPELPASNP